MLGPRLKYPTFDGKMPVSTFDISTIEAQVNESESKVKNENHPALFQLLLF